MEAVNRKPGLTSCSPLLFSVVFPKNHMVVFLPLLCPWGIVEATISLPAYISNM